MERLVRWLEQAQALAAGREPPQHDDADRVSAEKLRVVNEILEKRVHERTEFLRVLQDVAATANESRTIDEAFRRILERVAKHNGWCFGHVYLPSRRNPKYLIKAKAYYEESPGRFAEFIGALRGLRIRKGVGLPGRVYATGEADSIRDFDSEIAQRGVQLKSPPKVKTAAAFPVKVDDEVLAVFEFLSDHEFHPDDRILDSMASIGTHLGLFVHRKRMERTIVELSTNEQQRIGRDLHDHLGQQLTGVALLAKSLERELREKNSQYADLIAEIASGLREAQAHVRALARGLSLVEVDAEGLMKALRDLAKQSAKRLGIEVVFKESMRTLVPDNDVAVELYRIAQEAVTNAAKHGRANRITIELMSDLDELELTVHDNGKGISDSKLRHWGLGMNTMRYRANMIGGDLTVERHPEGGTLVSCYVNYIDGNHTDTEDEDPDACIEDLAD